MQGKRLGGLPLGLVFTAVFVQGCAAQSQRKKLYLLKDEDHQQWCALGNKATWQAEVQTTSSPIVAVVGYEDNHIITIDITEEDENGGDWIVYDRYTLDVNGIPHTLQRKSNVVSSGISVKDVFVIQDGQVRKESTATFKLSTGKPIPHSNEWFPDIPIMTSFQSFSFAPLLNDKRFKSEVKGKVCVHVRQ